MKYPTMLFLLTAVGMSSCETAKNAGFRVNWTFANTDTVAPRPASQPSPSLSPTPEQRVVKTKRVSQPEPAQPGSARSQSQPTPTPMPTPKQVAEKTEPHASTTPAASSRGSTVPFAKPVPGKPGYVYSPFDTRGGYIDVTGYPAGSLAKDPYSGKIFRVP